jgi:outer membrane protein
MRKETIGCALSLTWGVAVAMSLLPLSAGAGDQGRIAGVGTSPARESAAPKEMSLEECLTAAMQNSHRRPASTFAVAMAEAQHRQALAGYWPQIGLKAAYERMDEAPNFVFPASQMDVPAQAITVPAGTALITIPAGVLGPSAVQLPVSTPAQTVATSAQSFPIPAQDVKLMNPESEVASVNVTWLLYDGGMRRGYREQGRAFVDLMKEESRRTDLEIVDSVKRLYHGAVLARQLRQLGADTLARMEATLELTETMYKEGSGKVKKTDYLDNKVMVESLRSMVILLEKNEAMARAGLANTMGLPWNASVTPADRELPFTPLTANLDGLVADAYRFSPDWARVEAGLRAAEGAERTAQSGHYPKLAVTGDLHRWWNGYDAGVATDQNKEGWTVSLGVDLPLFDGFLTRNKVAEARARVNKIKNEQLLFKEGLGLQIKDLFLSLGAAQKSYQATLDAMTAAQENRDLNTRAYQSELVETEKVIRAQLVEALMSAQHFKTRYDNLALRSQLDLLVGTEIVNQLGGR